MTHYNIYRRWGAGGGLADLPRRGIFTIKIQILIVIVNRNIRNQYHNVTHELRSMIRGKYLTICIFFKSRSGLYLLLKVATTNS